MTVLNAGRPAPRPSWARAAAAVVGTALMLAVLVIAFALPAAHSAPHHVPIGAVGTPQQVEGFSSRAIAFSVHPYSSEADARAAILRRDIYGAVVLDAPNTVNVLVATAASPAAAALVQAAGQQLSAATHRGIHIDDVRTFPTRDPKGTGLAAGALPLALGGWIGAMIIMLLVPGPIGRLIGAFAFAIIGGLTVVATLQFVIGTFDGNFWMISVAGIFGIAATCVTVLGLRELLGGAGLGVAAVLLVLLGNPLSGLATGPEFLPTPWGAVGQFLPPGATGTLMRDVALFDGHGATKPVITLACYLIVGLTMYVLAAFRGRRTGTVDVDRIEFDHRPRPNPNSSNRSYDPDTVITERLDVMHRQARSAPPPPRTAPAHVRRYPTNADPGRQANRPNGPYRPNGSTSSRAR